MDFGMEIKSLYGTLPQWENIFINEFTPLLQCLIKTSDYVRNWSCPNGHYREVRQLSTNKYCAVCTKDGQCNAVELSDNDVRYYKLDIYRVTEQLKLLLKTSPIKWLASPQPINKDLSIYKVGRYTSHISSITELQVFCCFTPMALSINVWHHLIIHHPYFILLCLGETYIDIEPPNAYRLYNLEPSFIKKEQKNAIENLHKQFHEVISYCPPPPLTKESNKRYRLGVSRQIQLDNFGHRRGADIKQASQEKYKPYLSCALQLAEKSPGKYSGHRLAQLTIQRMSQKSNNNSISERSLRDRINQDKRFKKFLKPHYRHK
jgi:hypothetical protein